MATCTFIIYEMLTAFFSPFSFLFALFLHTEFSSSEIIIIIISLDHILEIRLMSTAGNLLLRIQTLTLHVGTFNKGKA